MGVSGCGTSVNDALYEITCAIRYSRFIAFLEYEPQLQFHFTSTCSVRRVISPLPIHLKQPIPRIPSIFKSSTVLTP